MKLSVPLLYDPGYLSFLCQRKDRLAALYLPLDAGPVLDARIRTRASRGIEALHAELSPLALVKKYLLLNTRFTLPATYTDPKALVRILDTMAAMARVTPIHGIVFTDFYLLRALDRTGHDLVPLLEAVPGVNCMLDTWPKVSACLDLISQTRFRPPLRLILDRSLNRETDRISAIAKEAKRSAPDLEIELLANEGCLLHCPFKVSHDAQIALSNTGLVREMTSRINREVGCHPLFFLEPERFLKSPFIRPEDLVRYQGLVQGIKICGRTLGPRFLTRCILAYESGSFEGNLLELMDAANFLSDHFHLDNRALGPDFFDLLSSCSKNCKDCRICKGLLAKAGTKKAFTLKPYEAFQ